MKVQHQNGAIHKDIESKLQPRRDGRITFQMANENAAAEIDKGMVFSNTSISKSINIYEGCFATKKT